MLLCTWLFAAFVGPPATYDWAGKFIVIYINQCVYLSYGRTGDAFVALIIFVPMIFIGLSCTVILIKSVMAQRTKQRVMVAAVNGAAAAQAKKRAAANPQMRRRLEMAVLLFTSFLWGAACDLPWTVLVEGFPHLFIEYPILTVWIHSALDAQYSVSPVSYCQIACQRSVWVLRSVSFWPTAVFNALAQHRLQDLGARRHSASTATTSSQGWPG